MDWQALAGGTIYLLGQQHGLKSIPKCKLSKLGILIHKLHCLSSSAALCSLAIKFQFLCYKHFLEVKKSVHLHCTCTSLPYKAFSYYYEVMKMFNISDVNDDDNGWSMMEHRVMSYCNLSWPQVITE